MRVSVVMAVYNGEKYLLEQLQSLKDQTRNPDEVIIMNDCSSDNTVEMIKDFIKEFALENWNIINNISNLGWRKNFIEGLKKSTGDYIFLCDQDDIWHNDKIECMTKALDENEQILLLASNYNYLYEDGMEEIKNKFKNCDKTVTKYPFDKRFFYVERPGCVYALRRQLADIVINEWYERSAHDSLAWRIANIMDGLYIYNDTTIEFRRHPESATAERRNSISDKVSDCKFWIESMKHLIRICEKYYLSQEKLKVLRGMKKFAEERLMMFESRNPIRWFKCIKYHEYYYSMKVMVGDMYYVMFGRGEKK